MFQRWPKRDPNKHYYLVPNEVFNLGLSSHEIAVYNYLLRCEDRRTYQCHPSYRTIGRAVQLSENTVRKYVAGLEEKGLIRTEPIDEEELRLFLCDERRGNLTDEQKSIARRGRDEMRSVYSTAVLRMLLCNEMMFRSMVPDISTYRSVFCSEGGDAPWMIDRAG